MIKFLYNTPAAIVADALVVSDLHVGSERENKVKTGTMVDRIAGSIGQLLAENKLQKLVLLGDVKSSITVSDEEKEELPVLFEKLGELAEVHVVPGNHDGGLDPYARRAIFHDSTGWVYEGVGFNHGHAWPSEGVMQCNWLMAGHNHPCVVFKDKLGARSVEKAFLIIEANETKLVEKYPSANKEIRMVVMPSFSDLVSGTPVNELEGSRLLGPLLKNKVFKIETAQVVLVNGTRLGRFKDVTKKDV